MGWRLVSLGPIGQEPPCRRARPMSITRKPGKVDKPEGSRSQPVGLVGAGPGLR
jgi:hypothetical protein